jgi:hypothetical protein
MQHKYGNSKSQGEPKHLTLVAPAQAPQPTDRSQMVPPLAVEAAA